MRYRLTYHARQRVASRGVDESHLKEGLTNVVSQWDDAAQGSVVLTCKTRDGRLLAVFVVGQLPLSEPVTIKSVAWR